MPGFRVYGLCLCIVLAYIILYVLYYLFFTRSYVMLCSVMLWPGSGFRVYIGFRVQGSGCVLGCRVCAL